LKFIQDEELNRVSSLSNGRITFGEAIEEFRSRGFIPGAERRTNPSKIEPRPIMRSA